MKAKRLFSLLALVLCLSVMFSACGQAPEEKEEDTQPEPVPAAEPEPVIAEPVMYDLPEGLDGGYHEKYAGRGQLTLTYSDKTRGVIFIRWASSAWQSTEWTLPVVYDEGSDVLVYGNGIAVDRIYTSEEEYTETVRYTDGYGLFEIGDDGSLTWHDHREDINDPAIFVRNEEGQEVDEWFETEDLTEAVNGSGISLYPPVEGEGVPEGMHFWKYRYREGTIKVLFESVNDELIISKSTVMKERELAEDETEYSQEWDQSVKGLAVHCYGDGTLANLMTFHVDDENWTITFNRGYEGNGIDAAQIQSIIMNMP